MTEPFMLRALIAGLALALVAAPLGCFVVWRRMAYFGETIAQGGLIGMALGIGLSIDGTIAVLLSSLALAALLLVLQRQKVVPLDSVLGVMAHAALAIGIVAATVFRGPSVDLMAILFGDIYAVTTADLRWIIVSGDAIVPVRSLMAIPMRLEPRSMPSARMLSLRQPSWPPPSPTVEPHRDRPGSCRRRSRCRPCRRHHHPQPSPRP